MPQTITAVRTRTEQSAIGAEINPEEVVVAYKEMKNRAIGAALAMISTAVACYARADTFKVTYLSSGVQTPTSTSYMFETFQDPTYVDGSLTTTFGGSPITGTYTGSYVIASASQFGGAGGSGNYIYVPSGGSYDLTLNSAANYFGLWFSALDPGNELQFYNNDTLLYSFSSTSYTQLVGACPTNQAEPNYCGNPNPSFYADDSREQFAYLNFYDVDGQFTKLVFTQAANGGEFESHNQIVELRPNGAPVTGSTLTVTPEPSSLYLLGTGLLGLGAVVRRQKRMWRKHHEVSVN